MAAVDPQVQEHFPLINWAIGGAVTLFGLIATQVGVILKIGAWKHSVLTRTEADKLYMDKIRCGEHHALIERELADIKRQNADLGRAVAAIQTNIAVMATQMAADQGGGPGAGSSAAFRRRSVDSHGPTDFPRILPLGAGEDEAAL